MRLYFKRYYCKFQFQFVNQCQNHSSESWNNNFFFEILNLKASYSKKTNISAYSLVVPNSQRGHKWNSVVIVLWINNLPLYLLFFIHLVLSKGRHEAKNKNARIKKPDKPPYAFYLHILLCNIVKKQLYKNINFIFDLSSKFGYFVLIFFRYEIQLWGKFTFVNLGQRWNRTKIFTTYSRFRTSLPDTQICS